MNNLDSWRAFLWHVKKHKSPPSRPPTRALLCPGPTGGLGGPLDPQPNLLFSKMTVVSFYKENPEYLIICSRMS